jgi:putative flippase GtrA
VTPALHRIVRFNLVGAIGVAVQLAVVHASVGAAGLTAVQATAAGVVAAVAHNFVWHWRWTWRDRRMPAIGRAFVGFAATNGALSFAANLAIVFVLTRWTPVRPVTANAVAIAACGVANFVFADRVVFRASIFSGARISNRTRLPRSRTPCSPRVPV